MPPRSYPRTAVERALIWLAVMNGASVSTLYWAQSLVRPATSEFGASRLVGLMPGATLAGYAAGVALLAAVAKDLTSATGLILHLLLLTTGLCLVASAAGPGIALGACLIIGLGCSLTQRLLACATNAVSPEARSETIGWIIAAGLSGIVLARACVPSLSAWLGWRGMFWADALFVTTLGLAATRAYGRPPQRCQFANPAPLPSAALLWRQEGALRRAALQQGIVFAAFNLGWALYPRLLAIHGVAPSIPMGIVASLGAGAAIVSGRICRRVDPKKVATSGLLAASVAITLLIASYVLPDRRTLPLDIGLMIVLDVGTQVALVANQARGQGLASSPAMRGRLTAIVTTIGFAGGAAGAVLGNLIT